MRGPSSGMRRRPFPLGRRGRAILAILIAGVVAWFALGLSFANLVWAYTHLPETRPEAGTGAGPERSLHPFRALRGIDYPGVRRTNLDSRG